MRVSKDEKRYILKRSGIFTILSYSTLDPSWNNECLREESLWKDRIIVWEHVERCFDDESPFLSLSTQDKIQCVIQLAISVMNCLLDYTFSSARFFKIPRDSSVYSRSMISINEIDNVGDFLKFWSIVQGHQDVADVTRWFEKIKQQWVPY